MKKNFFIYIVLSVSLFVLNNCEHPDDFLNIRPHASIVTGSYYSTMEEADEAIAAAYSMFNTVAQWDRNMIMIFGNIASDDAEAGGDHVNEVPDIEVFNRMIYLPTSNNIYEVYANFYRGIYFSNLAIENLPNVAELDEDADSKLLDKRIAEAHFVRAINYFYLTMVYGGVQYVDRIIGPSDYEMGRSTIKEIYKLIESDLKHCIKYLPEKSAWGPSNVGRASKGAAMALLSRLYLYESSYAENYTLKGFNYDNRFEGMEVRWDEALDYAQKVINSGEYRLVGIGGERYDTWRGPDTDGYRYIFTSNGDNSDEAVFEIQCVQEGLGWAQARGSSLAQWTSARYFLDNGNRESTDYWGLNWPSLELVAAFEDGDPRFHTTISQDGDSVQIQNNVWVPIDASASETGYFTSKFEASSEEFKDVSGAPWHSSPLNVKLIRFAEVYLNAAEAAYKLGQTEPAREYINEVRTRARMCGDTDVPENHDNITFEKIMNERRIELALEGHRYFDLVRWGEQIAEQHLTRETVDGFDVQWDYPKHLFFPVPQREVDVTKGGLKQYEGW